MTLFSLLINSKSNILQAAYGLILTLVNNNLVLKLGMRRLVIIRCRRPS